MRRVLFDTNVFVYALGGQSPYREPCRDVMHRAAVGLIAGEGSVDLVQEFLHQRVRRTGDRVGATAAARRIAALLTLHEIASADVTRALVLFEQHPRLSPRDATFVAIALNRGVEAILTADRDFDGLPGIERIDPRDTEAVAALET